MLNNKGARGRGPPTPKRWKRASRPHLAHRKTWLNQPQVVPHTNLPPPVVFTTPLGHQPFDLPTPLYPSNGLFVPSEVPVHPASVVSINTVSPTHAFPPVLLLGTPHPNTLEESLMATTAAGQEPGTI